MDHIYKENDLKVLRQTWESSFDLRRRATEKGILNDERNSKIIIRVYHWIRKSPFVFEDGYRTINFWDCDDNKFFHLIKFNIVCNLRKNEQIVILDHQVNIKELSILEAGGVLDLDPSLCCVPFKLHTFCVFLGDVETTSQVTDPNHKIFNDTWKIINRETVASNKLT